MTLFILGTAEIVVRRNEKLQSLYPLVKPEAKTVKRFLEFHYGVFVAAPF
jgi:hypothetical protein